MNRHSMRPTPSMIIALLALVVAMSTGAYAVTIAPKNSVVSKSIKNGQVRTPDLAKKAVKANKLANGAVRTPKLANGSVRTAKLANGSVTGPKIGSGQVGPGHLDPALLANLHDAQTVGGLSVAQIVAAAGGKYFDAVQAPGSTSIEVVPANAASLVSLDLPAAGKYLVTARVPVTCTYNGSDGPTPADPAPQQPFFYAQARLLQGGTALQVQRASCAAEARFTSFLAGSTYQGTAMAELTQALTIPGPTTLTLQASSVASGIFAPGTVAGERINATAAGASIQAITVQ